MNSTLEKAEAEAVDVKEAISRLTEQRGELLGKIKRMSIEQLNQIAEADLDDAVKAAMDATVRVGLLLGFTAGDINGTRLDLEATIHNVKRRDHDARLVNGARTRWLETYHSMVEGKK
jgi:hypothetical protein